MYSYDNPLISHHTIAAANFASQAAVVLPVSAGACLAVNPVSTTGLPAQARVLSSSCVFGISGVVGTAGTGTIQIGDGVTVARYGVITLTASVTANNAIIANVLLTNEGMRMGVANGTTPPTTFTLTFAGTAVINNLKVIYGHF